MDRNFTERTKNFWGWFTENEEKLSSFMQNTAKPGDDTNRIVAFINEGLSLISNELHFNIGGDHEFTFSVSGNGAMFFVLPYITANLPEPFRGKWKFFPHMPGTGGNNFIFRMIEHENTVDTDNVFVSTTPGEDEKTVDLQFWAQAWENLEDNECCNAFLTLMEISIGEAFAYTFIDKVDRAKVRTDEMFPLTTLEKWLQDNLCKEGENLDPANRYFTYQANPNKEEKPPREDIFSGIAKYAPIMSDYIDEQDTAYKFFTGLGIKPIFLYYYYNEQADREEILNLRYQLEDKLETEVLGEQGSGNEIGLLLGGAVGNWCVYVDLLLYDEQAFFEKVKQALADTPFMFFCQEFVHDGQTALLFDDEDESFNDRLHQLHEAGVHHEIADILEMLPQMDYTQTSLYARALNNLGDFNEAIKVLESIREQGENDKVWHFRYGYALLFADRPKEALAAFQRAKELGDDFEDTNRFIAMCEEAMAK